MQQLSRVWDYFFDHILGPLGFIFILLLFAVIIIIPYVLYLVMRWSLQARD